MLVEHTKCVCVFFNIHCAVYIAAWGVRTPPLTHVGPSSRTLADVCDCDCLVHLTILQFS